MADIAQEHLTNADKLCVSTDGKYTVTGDGVFDDIMEAVNLHLDSQFRLNRIVGSQYAEAYAGSLQSSLGAAVQFVLGEQQADKQAELTQKQTELVIEQITTEKLKHEQIKAQTLQIKAQTELIKAQEELTLAKICTEKAQACGPGPVEGTVAHAQMELLKKQEESFDRNNENKFLQVVLNAQAANSNVAGEPLCAVGAYQASGADSLIRSVGSKHNLSVPGPSDSCAWEEASVKKRDFEAQKIEKQIREERARLGIADPDAVPASDRSRDDGGKTL